MKRYHLRRENVILQRIGFVVRVGNLMRALAC
jgi:hypothetical protein